MPLVSTRGAASAQGFGEFSQSGQVNYIEDVFSTYLYTGNGSTQTITNGIDLSTKGGLVWIKDRDSGAKGHALFDTARGVNLKLQTQSTNGEFSGANQLTAFNTTGFALGSSTDPNGSGTTYVSWTFREQAKFFDVVTYTGNGTTQNIAHALGSTPGCVIIKKTSGAADWVIWHRGLSAGYYIRFTTSAEQNAFNDAYFGNSVTYVDPTSTQFTVGYGDLVNTNGQTYVAYIFAHNAGGFGLTGADNVISCGSFTTDGSGNATVNLGYEPQWLMTKCATNPGFGTNWSIYDTMRAWTGNGASAGNVQLNLIPNLSNAESNDNTSRPTATGFEAQSTFASSTIIYIAIRRGPMKVPTVGTSVFTPIIYSGDGLTRQTLSSVSNVTDLNFTACRNTAGWVNPGTNDRLRGIAAYLQTDGTAVELASSSYSVYPSTNTQTQLYAGQFVNSSGKTFVNYSFSRAPGFFDEVCYTGTGSATTVTHNLGVVPELMIVKNRGTVVAWKVYHSAIGNTKFLELNDTAGSTTGSTIWNDTTPTSSVFTVGSGAGVNQSGVAQVAYLFATCAGVSKVGSYTGTATTKQIDCGFTAGSRFVLIKRTDSTGDWYYWDSARGIIAGNDPYLLLNNTDAEVTGTDYVDTYNAGFELTSTAPAALNASGGTYIFLAIA